MGKTSRESVEERDLSDQSFSCSGGPKLPSVQTSTSYLHHCACCTPPLPYPITAGKKIRILWSGWLHQRCMQYCLCKKCSEQQNWVVGEDPFPHPAGNTPPSSPGCCWLWGTLFCGHLVSPGPPGLFLADVSPLCTDQCVRLFLLRCRSLHFSLYYTLFKKKKTTRNEMLNLCIQFALGAWDVDCCILSPWRSSRWEIVPLNTATRKWIQMKWYIADDDCYFPLHWNCSMICGSL